MTKSFLSIMIVLKQDLRCVLVFIYRRHGYKEAPPHALALATAALGNGRLLRHVTRLCARGGVRLA